MSTSVFPSTPELAARVLFDSRLNEIPQLKTAACSRDECSGGGDRVGCKGRQLLPAARQQHARRSLSQADAQGSLKTDFVLQSENTHEMVQSHRTHCVQPRIKAGSIHYASLRRPSHKRIFINKLQNLEQRV